MKPFRLLPSHRDRRPPGVNDRPQGYPLEWVGRIKVSKRVVYWDGVAVGTLPQPYKGWYNGKRYHDAIRALLPRDK